MLRCRPPASVDDVAARELARELDQVRWQLHCRRNRLDALDAERFVLRASLEKLEERAAQIEARLAELRPEEVRRCP